MAKVPTCDFINNNIPALFSLPTVNQLSADGSVYRGLFKRDRDITNKGNILTLRIRK